MTLERPTPAPGNKLIQLLAENNLTQHVHETTRQNNTLDLVISTEEELIVNLKITDKIGDHQGIKFSIKIEKGNIASEKGATINNPSWINNDVKQAIGRRQRAYETKRRINNEETVAEYIEAKSQVKRIVKQEKRNKELSIARICKHNPKSFYSYINERRIVRDNSHSKLWMELLSQQTMTWPKQ